MAKEPAGEVLEAGVSGAEAGLAPGRRGLTIARRFTTAGTSPFDEVEWETRAAVIQGEGGETVFEQRDVEVPRRWSQLDPGRRPHRQTPNRSIRADAHVSREPSGNSATVDQNRRSSSTMRLMLEASPVIGPCLRKRARVSRTNGAA